ncbi:glycosyltransferase family 2 protein [Novosphingobium sp. PASSN1]|uniref:glycosyltransferase family 2 protein n=1 Tax=Novosphingobium sp. PASSN1 TaxID=2015561 RepID=UPI0025F73408|nr:glycosyltransferase family 2 protein [Novosphingobium sp. PASSN1]
MLRIHIAIATVGRPALLRETVDLIARQTRRPDGVLIVAPSQEDFGSVTQSSLAPELALSAKGSCRQRNHALDLLEGRADVVLFLDDDFVMAPDYLAAIEALFMADPGIAGITGNLVADGVRLGGFTAAQALDLIAQQAASLDPAVIPREALYGCNMALRMAHMEGLRFDEALPLYGWQEDIDLTMRLARRGRLISSGRVTGVHLGVRGGRTSGRRLGYSQVANLVYLLRKGTIPKWLAQRLFWQNLAANLLRAPFPEPHIDRAGRLAGNVLALTDLALGRIDPRKIERM